MKRFMELGFQNVNVISPNLRALSFGIFDCYILIKEIIHHHLFAILASYEKYLRTCHFFAGHQFKFIVMVIEGSGRNQYVYISSEEGNKTRKNKEKREKKRLTTC